MRKAVKTRKEQTFSNCSFCINSRWECNTLLFCSCFLPSLCDGLTCSTAVQTIKIIETDFAPPKISSLLGKVPLDVIQFASQWVPVTRLEFFSQITQQYLHGTLTQCNGKQKSDLNLSFFLDCHLFLDSRAEIFQRQCPSNLPQRSSSSLAPNFNHRQGLRNKRESASWFLNFATCFLFKIVFQFS